jgi:hypothetical protein
MNYTPIRLKNTPLTLSAILFSSCLVIPLTATADTSSSVDAIMEQLKSFKAPVPKVSAPATPIVVEETVKSEPIITKPVEPIEPVKTINKEPPSTGIYVSPTAQKVVTKQEIQEVIEAPKRVRTKRPVRTKRLVKDRRVARANKRVVKARTQVTLKKSRTRKTKKRVNKRKNSAVDYKGFDERYMSLINDILNDRVPARKATQKTTKRSENAIENQTIADILGGNFSGLSGWIFVGKYSAGHWRGGKTLKSGNQLPQVGQQYTVKSPLLNMRKSKPTNKGLGKLIKVLHVGDQVRIKSIHRSSKNNYWANIVRP